MWRNMAPRRKISDSPADNYRAKRKTNSTAPKKRRAMNTPASSLECFSFERFKGTRLARRNPLRSLTLKAILVIPVFSKAQAKFRRGKDELWNKTVS
jgi:hypothetical protein